MNGITPPTRWIHALLLFAWALTGCVSLPQREMLPAIGPLVTDPVIVRGVLPDSEAAKTVRPGDRMIALDGTPITSFEDGFKYLGQQRPSSVTVERAGQGRIELPFTVFADENNHFDVLFLKEGEVFTIRTTSLSGLPARAALVSAGRMGGTIALSRWETNPNLLEVEIALSVPQDCTDCELKDVYVMDWSRRAWLSPVPMQTAAYAVLPDLGAPGVPVPVPPPTVVGQISSTTATGTLSANTYGNYTSGQFTGNAITTTTPIYDYSAQSAAAGYNLGVAIRNAQIESSNKARYNFVAQRLGNLRAGKLNSGEQLTGHLFFAAPAGFEGPYVIFLDGGENARGAAMFGVQAR